MSQDDGELTGPDLTQGVAPELVPEGGSLLGHAHGKGVLLARSGKEVFAIEAKCSHYGGPLAEGLVVGDTVRCPWHHACFSLRTGEAVAAPALTPVACFEVAEKSGKLYVLGAREPKARAEARGPESVVIVGAGAAGNACAEMLRSEGYAGTVTMIGADESVPYDRPNISKDYLAGNAPEEWIPLRSAEFYEEKKITLKRGTRVTALDPARKSITLGDGSSLTYGALLLATGAEPIRLQLPGVELAHVHYLRTLADSRALIAASETAKRVVVVGSSFIGLEVAASLRARGLEVAVVAPETVPLARIVGAELGAEVRRVHESHGVQFHLGRKPAAIDADFVTLDDGAKIAADLVVFGVGVRPSLELAESAGLSLDRGVLVDEYLKSSAPDIYAAGDIARYRDLRSGEALRVEHWVVAERQGQVAARNMLGHKAAFDAAPFFWSAHYDLTISYVGHAEAWDSIDVSGSIAEHDCALAYRKAGKTLAVVTLGRDRVGLQAEIALQKGDEAALRALIP